jgi:hypothetical protein
MHTLIESIEIRHVGAALAAGSAIDNNSAIIDMAGYDSVTFIAAVSASAAGGVATLTVEANEAEADAGMVAVSGAVASATSPAANDLADKLLVVEVARPAKRFVQAVRTSASANITFGPVVALLVPRRRPAAADASQAASARVSD